MGYDRKILALATMVLLMGTIEIMALRPLEGDQWMQQKKLVFQSLQRGPVRGSQSNPCSTISGHSHGRCTLSQNDVVVHPPSSFANAPPPYPQATLKFGAV